MAKSKQGGLFGKGSPGRESSLAMGSAPPGFHAQHKAALALRRRLEAAVVAERGDVSLPDASTIITAARAELRAAILHKLIRQAAAATATLDKIPELLAQQAKANAERDAAIAKLAIDDPPASPGKAAAPSRVVASRPSTPTQEPDACKPTNEPLPPPTANAATPAADVSASAAAPATPLPPPPINQPAM